MRWRQSWLTLGSTRPHFSRRTGWFSKAFLSLSPSLGKWSNLTNKNLSGWFNHQLDMIRIWFQYDFDTISIWFQYDFKMIPIWSQSIHIGFPLWEGSFLPRWQNVRLGAGGGGAKSGPSRSANLGDPKLTAYLFCSTGYAEYFRICWVSLAFFRICWILFALFVDILSFIRIFLGYGWVWLALFIDMLSLIYWHFEFHWHYFGYVEFHLHYLLTFWVSFALFRKRLNLISIRSLYHQEEHVSPYSSGRSGSSKHLWTHQREKLRSRCRLCPRSQLTSAFSWHILG